MTEEHASKHNVDTISKIQPVNNSIWQRIQFPPQTIAKGEIGEAGTYRLREMKDVTQSNAMCGICLDPQ